MPVANFRQPAFREGYLDRLHVNAPIAATSFSSSPVRLTESFASFPSLFGIKAPSRPLLGNAAARRQGQPQHSDRRQYDDVSSVHVFLPVVLKNQCAHKVARRTDVVLVSKCSPADGTHGCHEILGPRHVPAATPRSSYIDCRWATRRDVRSWPDPDAPILVRQVRSLGSSSRAHGAPETARLVESECDAVAVG